MSNKPGAFEKWPKGFSVKFGPYRAVVDRVMDGDTYLVIADLGMGEYVPKEIRLLDYSSPESDTPEGKAAKAFAETLLPRDTRVRLYPEKDEFNATFSRWVARVELEDGKDVGITLYESGYARKGRFKG